VQRDVNIPTVGEARCHRWALSNFMFSFFINVLSEEKLSLARKY
jgi:hypothetical protein